VTGWPILPGHEIGNQAELALLVGQREHGGGLDLGMLSEHSLDLAQLDAIAT